MPAQSYQLAEVHDSSDGQLFSAAISKDLSSVFATGGEKDVSLYSVEAELGGQFQAKRIMQFQGHQQSITALTFNDSPDDTPNEDKLLASGSFSGTIRTWDIEAGRASRSLPAGHTTAISSLSFFTPPKYLVSGSLDTTVRLWDLRRKGAISVYRGHRDRVTCVKFSPDGEWLISGGADNQLRLIDLRNSKVLKRWDEDLDEKAQSIAGVNFVQFHPSDMLMCANFGKKVKVIELENFEVVSELPLTAHVPRTGIFGPGGGSFMSVFEDGFQTSAWEPGEKLEHVRCGWHWPVASTLSAEDNALRVLSLGKSSAHLHTINLAEVKTKRDAKRPLSPRKTFERREAGQDDSWNNRDDSKNELQPQETDVQVFGKLPQRKSVTPSGIPAAGAVPPRKQSPLVAPAQPGQYGPYGQPAPVHPVAQQGPGMPYYEPPNQPQQPAARPPYGGDARRGIEPGEVLVAPSYPQSQQHLNGNADAGQPRKEKHVTNDTLLKYISGNHSSIDEIFTKRLHNLDQINAQWSTGDIISTTRLAIGLGSSSAVLDLLNLIVDNPSIWTLELVTVIISKVGDILSMSNKIQQHTGSKTLDLILRSFQPVIKATLEQANYGGNQAVDLQREQRESRCKYVRDVLKNKIAPIVTLQKHQFMIDQIP